MRYGDLEALQLPEETRISPGSQSQAAGEMTVSGPTRTNAICVLQDA